MVASEEQIQLALRALRDGSISSVRQAAYTFNVPRSTLQHRFNGRPDTKDRQVKQQRLTVAEEHAIVQAIYTLSRWGWPMSIQWLQSFATNLLRKKGDTNELGPNWHLRFLDRHPDLRTKWSTCVDQNRKDAQDIDVARNWFELFNDTRTKYGIYDEDIYNMDEKGFMKGIATGAKVIIPRGSEATTCQPGNREWVTIIEAISGNGVLLPAFVIFEGKIVQERWISRRHDPRMRIAVSDRGWTDHELAIQWLMHFDENTKEMTRGTYRLLLLDGHGSHCSIDFVKYCEDRKIILLCLPPHSTHFLQALDVCFFGPLALGYKQIIRDKSLFGAERVTNEQFLDYYQEARQACVRHIPTAWQKVGLIPFNPNVVLDAIRPVTPPASMTIRDSRGNIVDIWAERNPDLAAQIDDFVDKLKETVTTPVRIDLDHLKAATLSVIAECNALSLINEALVEKQKDIRVKKSSRQGIGGKGRVLTVEEAQNEINKRAAAKAEEAARQERYHLLRGKVGFVKLVWKELKIAEDVFD